MRCLFTMFAEDVELIRKNSFSELLLSLRFKIKNFQPMVESLWEAMDQGKFSTILRGKIKHFNGKFFKDKTALPLTHDQLELLIERHQAIGNSSSPRFSVHCWNAPSIPSNDTSSERITRREPTSNGWSC